LLGDSYQPLPGQQKCAPIVARINSSD